LTNWLARAEERSVVLHILTTRRFIEPSHCSAGLAINAGLDDAGALAAPPLERAVYRLAQRVERRPALE
jgi:hypothetical protein